MSPQNLVKGNVVRVRFAARDDGEWVERGFDSTNPPAAPSPPPRRVAQGGRFRGAFGGSVLGAVGGAIAGNSGDGDFVS
jgi:hypothetical protein